MGVLTRLPMPLNVPPTVAGVSVSDVGEDFFTVSWTPVVQATYGYHISIYDAGDDSLVDEITVKNVSEYEFTGFAAGTYYARVKAVGGGGESPGGDPSAEFTVGSVLHMYRYHFLADGEELEVLTELSNATVFCGGKGGDGGIGGDVSSMATDGGAGGGGGGVANVQVGQVIPVGVYPVIADATGTEFFGISAAAGGNGSDGVAYPGDGAGGSGGSANSGGGGGGGGRAELDPPEADHYGGGGGGGGGGDGAGGAGDTGTGDPPSGVGFGDGGPPAILSGYGDLIDGPYGNGGHGYPTDVTPVAPTGDGGDGQGGLGGPGIVVVRYRTDQGEAVGGFEVENEE